MRKLFTEHPNSIGETYGEHAYYASRAGVRMMLAGFACIIHSIFPFIFINTASQTVKDLHQTMIARTSKSE
ncbi:MAG: DUF6356 family protein [Gammaproteobacteria bacterium]|jgi:hypothetical protein